MLGFLNKFKFIFCCVFSGGKTRGSERVGAGRVNGSKGWIFRHVYDDRCILILVYVKKVVIF